MQFQFSHSLYSIKPSVGSIVFVIFTMLLTASLAVWQYQRGLASQQRQALIKQSGTEVTSLEQTKHASLNNYTAIQVTGRWRLPTLLLDSQIHTPNTNNNQKFMGYHVYSILETTQGNLLIRRGWHKKSDDLALSPPKETSLTVLSYQAEANRFQTYWPESLEATTAIIPSLNIDKISASLQLDLLPFVGLLEAIMPSDLTEYSLKPITINTQSFLSPDKHFAYALQWLLLCFIAPIIYIFAALKKVTNND